MVKDRVVGKERNERMSLIARISSKGSRIMVLWELRKAAKNTAFWKKSEEQKTEHPSKSDFHKNKDRQYIIYVEGPQNIF